MYIQDVHDPSVETNVIHVVAEDVGEVTYEVGHPDVHIANKVVVAVNS